MRYDYHHTRPSSHEWDDGVMDAEGRADRSMWDVALPLLE